MHAVLTPTCIEVRGYVYEEMDEAEANRQLEGLIALLQAETLQRDEEGLIARRAVDEVYELYVKLLPGHD